jgi:hypothetical protein
MSETDYRLETNLEINSPYSFDEEGERNLTAETRGALSIRAFRGNLCELCVSAVVRSDYQVENSYEVGSSVNSTNRARRFLTRHSSFGSKHAGASLP